MGKKRIAKSGKNTDGIFVSARHPSGTNQNIVQEIVTECMFYLGGTKVDYADILNGMHFRKQTEVNN